METTMEKKLRKRMTVMEFERNRKLNAQCSVGTFPFSHKSLGEIKEKRETAAISASMCHDYSYTDERDDDDDDECNASILSDCVSEMRRRRVYEMHHNRPYPIRNNIKKKHKFWEPEEPPRPAVILTTQSSLSERCNGVTVISDQASREQPTSLSKEVNDNLEYLSKVAAPRVLWKVQTTNLHYDFEADVIKESRSDNNTTNYHYEDEIMKPMRIRRSINNKVSEIDLDTEEIINGNIMDNDSSPTHQTGFLPARPMVPTDTDNKAAVFEVQTATQALATFITNAAYVINEAKDPSEMDEIDSWTDKKDSFTLSSKSKDLQNSTGMDPKVEKKVTFTPTSEAINLKSSPEAYREATPIRIIDYVTNLSTTFTKQHITTSTPSNKPTVTTPRTTDTSMDEADMTISSPSVNCNAFNVNSLAVATLESDVLWPSLFGDNFAGVDSNAKTMLEALVQGGALQRENGEINTLKLFVDMYHKHTFEKIVQSIQCLKGLHALVICRGLDQTRPTYRSVQEMKPLLDALHSAEILESLMLLNFTSDCLTNVSTMLNQQSSIYRLQIQLVDGTLNGEILGAMAKAPRLTHVMLELKKSCSLGMLMNSKTIQTVQVNSKNLVLKDTHVRTLVFSLQSNFTLTSLDLASKISIDQFRLLCTTLRKNYRLESLRVNLVLRTESETMIAASQLATLFRENNMLINVWNYSHRCCFVSDTSKREVISALRNNKSMINFKFFSEDIDDWKQTVGGNQEWMQNLNTMSTSDASVSLLSGVSVTNSTGTKELVEDEFATLVNLVDDFLPFPSCDCVPMRNMGTDFHNWARTTSENFKQMDNWACATSQNVKRMEV